MDWIEDRIRRLELKLEETYRNRQDLTPQLRALQQGLQAAFQQTEQPSGGGGAISIGLTTSAITARSGTTPGSGTVAKYHLSGGVLTSLGSSVTAYLFSGTAGGIASGKYCSIGQDADNNWWILSVEC